MAWEGMISVARRGSGQRNSAKNYYLQLVGGKLVFRDSRIAKNVSTSRKSILIKSACTTPAIRPRRIASFSHPPCPCSRRSQSNGAFLHASPTLFSGSCARGELARCLTCRCVSHTRADISTIRWSAATISTPIETFQLFASKKKELSDEHLEKTHRWFQAMHNFKEAHSEVPAILSKFVQTSTTGHERMSIGRLGNGEVQYRPNSGHIIQDVDGDGVIDDEGVNKDVLRLSVALDLVKKMEVNATTPPVSLYWTPAFCVLKRNDFVAGHGKLGIQQLDPEIKPPHEYCEGALSQSAPSTHMHAALAAR